MRDAAGNSSLGRRPGVGRITGAGWSTGRSTAAAIAVVLAAVIATESAEAAVFTVPNNAANGGGSLRQAITNANGTAPGPNNIVFNIPGAPGTVFTISPTAAQPLPAITRSVTIDATGQNGYVANGLHTIEISGASAPAGAIALDVRFGVSATRSGLTINRYGNAIRLSGSSNVVQGCYLGTDPTGTLSRPNGVGIYIRSNNNQIDGTAAAGRNVISANTVDGIQIDGAGGGTGGSGNVIKGNYIGVTVAGNARLGNTGQGIAIVNPAENNTIGGGGAGNVSSSNRQNGITINSAGSNLNTVQGNFIGTDPTRTLLLGNSGRGISFDQGSASNTIGGMAAGAGNTIAHNGDQAIALLASNTLGNAILGNSIFDNGRSTGALGIDLNVNWVDLNDAHPDVGYPNNGQNHPVLSAAMTNGAGVATVAGSLNSRASRSYRVEFFANTTPHGSGYGEGQRYLGFTNVTTDPSGNAVF